MTMARPERFAVRNIRLCTKDCLCLYVCPTGATDTENSIIDVERCIGCGECAISCPSAAIHMVPYSFPRPQRKTVEVVEPMRALAASKNAQEAAAKALPGPLAAALARSTRVMAEDLIRESGFMTPQAHETVQLLDVLELGEKEEGFPQDALDLLRERLY